MANYSGRTTDLAHKFENWRENGLNVGEDCIKPATIFDVQWSNCPVEVEEEVMKMWSDYELGNDHYYKKWNSEDNGADYPLIDEYLKSRGVLECLIHWWW